ncbi:MAG: YceI family protein [Pseudonocardiales bacterium]
MSVSATGKAPGQLPVAGRYRVDPERTTVRLSTRHLFGLGGVTGTVRLREAEIAVGEPVTATTVRAVLDATSFDTGSARRDADVRSARFLDSATHPDITFACQGISQQNAKWVAAGTVTAHGVAAPVDLVLERLDDNGGELSLRATARVDRYAHQVTAAKGMAAQWLTVEIDAVACQARSGSTEASW